MIRNDFVSNSSSSSFIVKKCQDENVLKRLNDKFIHLIKQIPGYIIFNPKENTFSKELINKIKDNSIFELDMCYHQYDRIIINDLTKLNKDHLDIIKNILSECDYFCASSDIHDYGEYAPIMTQIATLFELVYLFHCEGDDYLNYQSIEKLAMEVSEI